MKILITGANGQVGTCLTKKLNGQVELLAVDRDRLDITDRNAVFNVVTSFQPDIIINAAAHTAVDKAEQQIDLSNKINCDGPQFLAEAAQETGAAILHISTDYVFNGNSVKPYIESDVVDPQSIYGKSKYAGELAVSTTCTRHIILRTAWVFCEDGNNFVKTMLRLGRERSSLGIVADQYGGPTYAGDIADALIIIAKVINKGEFEHWGIFHFCGMPYVTWFDFAEKIFDKAVENNVLPHKPVLKQLSTEEYPTPAKRPKFSMLDCNKINKTFDIQPSNWIESLNNINLYK
ncbi:dTDP-4-dehydrorhamnose reductase [Pectobacterium polaris]|uniref:dTDP-4-dehydrorhamnose reductase n=1 Tax=Pectobacterium polaris TaxID=2042057 RepID=UPI000BB385F2|nr:dTDP-4-dehydrorhamnose reductase [Pectobacterium polaris]ASY76557.1 dTDP-4-dehydrorhamnose reductase [Pectobacterium polaris]